MLIVGVGNVWGITTSDLETSAATTLTDGSTYVVATAYNGTYLTTGVSSGWGTASTSIGSAAIFTAHGSESGFYLTCSAGRLVPAASKTFSAYDTGTSNNLSLSASGEIQNSSNTSWKLRLNTNFRWYSSTTGSAVYLFKIKSATPTVTPDPTSLSWGTVLQGSSQSTKTITITGANLTAGTLTISATGGYSVTPTSKSVGGTLATTTLTVTPPSTSTAGTKNGKVTISGGGLASSVEVNLSMTVNAASTVTWMNNGSEYTTTLVENGSKPTFPATPSSCDLTCTTFYGWSTSAWSGSITSLAGKTIYTKASDMPDVSGDVTYYAVYSDGLTTEYTFTSSSWNATSGGSDANWTSGKAGAGYTAGQGVQVTTAYTGANATSPISFSNVNKVVVTYNTNKTAGAGSIGIKIGSNSEVTNNVAYDSGISDDGRSANFTTEYAFSPVQTGTIKLTANTTTNSIWPKSIAIYSGAATPHYITSCCTPLAQVEGSANLSQWNAGVHIY